MRLTKRVKLGTPLKKKRKFTLHSKREPGQMEEGKENGYRFD